MPYCGTFGCACCTCQKCFNSPCTCWQEELGKRTREFLNEDHEYEDGFHSAVSLLNEWIERTRH